MEPLEVCVNVAKKGFIATMAAGVVAGVLVYTAASPLWGLPRVVYNTAQLARHSFKAREEQAGAHAGEFVQVTDWPPAARLHEVKDDEKLHVIAGQQHLERIKLGLVECIPVVGAVASLCFHEKIMGR